MDVCIEQRNGGDMAIDIDRIRQRAGELEAASQETGYSIAFIQSVQNGFILEENNRLLREILTFEIDTATSDAENAAQRAGLLKKIMPAKPKGSQS